jgi:hypothetical protein
MKLAKYEATHGPLRSGDANAKPCPHCGKEIAGNSVVCPHWGRDVKIGDQVMPGSAAPTVVAGPEQRSVPFVPQIRGG